jgi:hypothetical protein
MVGIEPATFRLTLIYLTIWIRCIWLTANQGALNAFQTPGRTGLVRFPIFIHNAERKIS